MITNSTYDNGPGVQIAPGTDTTEAAHLIQVLQEEHAARIEAPERVRKNEIFTVTIEIGAPVPHPSGTDHRIEWIELYAGTSFLLRVTLPASRRAPRLSVPVRLTEEEGPLRVWYKCSRHGVMGEIREIAIER